VFGRCQPPSAPASVASEVQAEADSIRGELDADRQALGQAIDELMSELNELTAGAKNTLASARKEQQNAVEEARKTAQSKLKQAQSSAKSVFENARNDAQQQLAQVRSDAQRARSAVQSERDEQRRASERARTEAADTVNQARALFGGDSTTESSSGSDSSGGSASVRSPQGNQGSGGSGSTSSPPPAARQERQRALDQANQERSIRAAGWWREATGTAQDTAGRPWYEMLLEDIQRHGSTIRFTDTRDQNFDSEPSPSGRGAPPGDDARFKKNLERLREYLNRFAESEADRAQVERILRAMADARRRIMEKGGPVTFKPRFRIPFTDWQWVWQTGMWCSECEAEVLEAWPIGGGNFDYDTKTKEIGIDHVWGEISYRGRPIATIDFWQDPVDFWAPG